MSKDIIKSIKHSLKYSLSNNQIYYPKIYHNISQTDYYYHILQDNNNIVTNSKAIAVNSGFKKGRSPKDKRVLFDKNTYDIWWGPNSPNNYLSQTSFDLHRENALFHLNHKKNLFIFDGFAGWNKKYSIAVRVICENPYHALFMNNMLIRPTDEDLEDFIPNVTIYNAGSLKLEDDQINSKASVDFNFTTNQMVIIGTEYAGEMKKGVFTFMHYFMPKLDVLSLHSSVNLSKQDPDDITLFFGLSGTGKTTLSSDPNRYLIGDDEHCWSKEGLFNIEGGCYAKCIGLDANKEPEIWNAIQFGTVLENVDVQNDKSVDFNSSRLTQNTRASYPIEYIKMLKYHVLHHILKILYF